MKGISPLRIIVCGYIVRGPLGGISWHHLHYLLGLADLGHDVWFLEDSGDWPSCYDPARQTTDADPGYGLAYAARVFERTGFGQRWAYHDAMNGGQWHGPAASGMAEICRSADVVLNVSGINPLRPWLQGVPVRALIDTDPVFTQVDILQDPVQRAFAEGHNVFFTFAESFGQPGCTVPDDGLPWLATRQPVALRAWPVAPPPPPDARWTTVMLWDSYAEREWDGMRWGMKSQEMERLLDLPARCGPRFELALGGHTAPQDRLLALGWQLRDPLAVSLDPWSYQDYLRGSRAEFGAAKHGYVASGSGWFSERTANYLALGRPAVVQDTGFSRHLPTGEGLFAFDDAQGAAAAIDAVESNYARHASAARELVAEHFDASRVLTRLLEQATRSALAPPRPKPAGQSKGKPA
jgi:hypothetical protein